MSRGLYDRLVTSEVPILSFHRPVVWLFWIVALQCASLSLAPYRPSFTCEELYTLGAITGHDYRVYADTHGDGAIVDLAQYRRLLVANEPQRKPILDILRNNNNHVPLYFLIAHAFMAAFGTSEWSLRLPSLIFAVLLVVAIYSLTSELSTRAAGLLSAIMAAFFPVAIYYARTARMYTLLAFLTVLATYCLVLIDRRGYSMPRAGVYCVVSIAGIYTHYLFWLILAFHACYILIYMRRGFLRRYVVIMGVTMCCYLPWLPVLTTQFAKRDEYFHWMAAPVNNEAGATLLEAVDLLSGFDAHYFEVGGIIMLLVVFYSLWELHHERRILVLCLAWLGVTVGALIVADQIFGTKSIIIDRYWFAVTPSIYVSVAVGLSRIQNRWLRNAVIAMVLSYTAACAYRTIGGGLRRTPDEHRQLARYISERVITDPRHTVVVEGNAALPLALAYYSTSQYRVAFFEDLPNRDMDQVRRALGRGARCPNTWLVAVSPDSMVRQALIEGGCSCDSTISFGHVVAEHYTR